MMTRLVGWLFFAMLIVGGVLVVAPNFIDWNKHRAAVIARLEPSFDRKIDVAGGLSLRILPQPELMLEKVTIANATGGRAPALMTLGRLGMRIKLGPLLNGKVQVESLDLVDPVIHLETLPDGTGNWDGVLKPDVAATLGQAAGGVQLGRVTVSNGTLHYRGLTITGVNLDIAAATLRGPYDVNGRFDWRGHAVALTASSDRYDGATPVPLRVDLVPDRVLPQVSFTGVLDVKAGGDVQGELGIAQGAVSALLTTVALKDIPFLQEQADIKAVLETKGRQISLSDIKASFGQKGQLSGKLTVAPAPAGKTEFRLAAAVANLTLAAVGTDPYVTVPEGIVPHIDIKGKNVVWRGYRLPSLSLGVSAQGDTWGLRDLQATMTDGTKLSASGTVMPLLDSASYTVGLDTADAAKFAQGLPLPAQSIFKAIADTGAIRKLSMAGRLEVSPARLSLFNLDATLDGKAAASGVINVDRISTRPNVVARLNVNDIDTATLAPGGARAFAGHIRAADSDIELAGRNLTIGGVRMAELAFAAKSGAEGMEIAKADGVLADQGGFSLSGRIDPAGEMDLTYTLRAARLADMAAGVGIALPAPLRGVRVTGFEGTLKGAAYTGEGRIDGGGLSMAGRGSHVNVQMTHDSAATGWAMLGLPVTGLIGGNDKLSVSGSIKGAGDDYTIDTLRAKAGNISASGTYARQGGKITADLTSDRFDFDRWLPQVPKLKSPVTLTLQGSELIFNGQTIVNPTATVEADATTVKVAPLKGGLWGGKLDAGLALTRRGDKTWASAVRGKLQGAELGDLLAHMGIGGLSIAGADLDFDLMSADNTPAEMTGEIGFRFGSVVVPGFSFSRLLDLVDAQETVPPGFDQMVAASFRSGGATSFRDVQGTLTAGEGRLRATGVQMEAAAGQVSIDGRINMENGDYMLDGWLALKDARKMEPLKLRRASSKADYTVDVAPLRKYVAGRNPGPVPTAPDIGVVPQAVPVQQDSPIGGIIDRLDGAGYGGGNQP